MSKRAVGGTGTLTCADFPASGRTSHIAVRSGEGLLSDHIAGAQRGRRELLFMPHSCRSQHLSRFAQLGGEPSFQFDIRSAPKWCSRQPDFHHILSRRSPCGTDLGEMSEGRVERRLAAILAADVAGYSRLMGTDEEGTLAALRAVRRELADPKIAEHRGRIVKTTGDSLLVEFASVVDAVRCAVELQREMIARNAATAAERRVEFRMGINVGDIIIEDGDIFGDGVNIAARLEALAEPGGICLSAAAHEQVRDRLDIAFDDLGEQQVKNIARPVRTYRVAFGISSRAVLPVPRRCGRSSHAAARPRSGPRRRHWRTRQGGRRRSS